MVNPTNSLTFQMLASIELDGAEISAYDAGTQRVFTTSGDGLQIIDLSDPTSPQLVTTLDIGAVTSVSTFGGLVAVAVPAANRTDPGKVLLFDAYGALLNELTVGSLPDMVTFSPDGSKILVANEGESTFAEDVQNGVTFVNPVGSISVIDMSGGAASASVQTATFDAFNSQVATLKADGVRLFVGSPGFETTTVAQDLEPEYIAVAPDGQTAWVTLQEANSVAVVDLSGAAPAITQIIPLGLKSWDGLQFDPNDKDGAGIFYSDLPIFGMYMPDAIASYEVDGETYYVTANEGDDRDDFIDETARLKDVTLDPSFSSDLVDKAGRLTVPALAGVNGDTDGDGKIDQILTYGARSISVWDSSGNQVFDSGDLIDTFVAAHFPEFYDDGRSDNKGSEPEGVTIASFEGHTYAFIALERYDSTMVFDVTDPENPVIATFLAHAGDDAPESGIFISADDSATGEAMFLVSNEGSNTLTVFELATPDVMGGNGGDKLIGTISDDAMFGGNGDDYLFGNVGEDILRGGNGDDVLEGGLGSDWLFGGNGKDILIGGPGDDCLVGGNAADWFLFDNTADTGNDVIHDMTAIDQILLTAQLDEETVSLVDGILEFDNGSVEILGVEELSFESTVVYAGTTYYVYEASSFA